MIVKIPIKPHVKNFLNWKYDSSVFRGKMSDPVSRNLLMNFRHPGKGEILSDKVTGSYIEFQLPSKFVEYNKIYISKEGIQDFEQYIGDIMLEWAAFYCWVRKQDGIPYRRSLGNFLRTIGADEKELQFQTVWKAIQRLASKFETVDNKMIKEIIEESETKVYKSRQKGVRFEAIQEPPRG